VVSRASINIIRFHKLLHIVQNAIFKLGLWHQLSVITEFIYRSNTHNGLMCLEVVTLRWSVYIQGK
jgi:hypothetical protein